MEMVRISELCLKAFEDLLTDVPAVFFSVFVLKIYHACAKMFNEKLKIYISANFDQ